MIWIEYRDNNMENYLVIEDPPVSDPSLDDYTTHVNTAMSVAILSISHVKS